jgi:hypothetical protein
MNHTPGPWHVEHGETTETLIVDSQSVFVAEAAEDMEADARLIAAAPDLLAALERIEAHGREWDRSHLHEHECYEDIARAAIAKVKGQT